MRTTFKNLAWGSAAFVVFGFAVFVESGIRRGQARPMSIDGLPVKNASVTGTWMPDFLWTGKAWKIEIQTDNDLELALDDKIFFIPKGSHTVYSNHDATNTGQFGSSEFWGYPDKIAVRQIDEMP